MRSGLALALLVYAAPAFAHDNFCDGRPVPADIKAGCCGVADAHRTDASHVYQKDDGHWYFADLGKEWPMKNQSNEWIEPLPENDGCYTVWFNKGPDSSWYSFYCLMIPRGV